MIWGDFDVTPFGCQRKSKDWGSKAEGMLTSDLTLSKIPKKKLLI